MLIKKKHVVNMQGSRKFVWIASKKNCGINIFAILHKINIKILHKYNLLVFLTKFLKKV